METKTKQPKKHIGRNIRRMREMMGVKQEAIAHKLNTTQQSISNMEQKEKMDDEELGKVAEALGVTKEAIENFSEEAVSYYIQNNHEGANKEASNIFVQNYHCTFNPIDKWVEAIEENKKLYEALLKAEKEKNALLQKIIDGKK